MSNVRCINFWDLCRICTASSEQKINIYSPDGRAKNLSQKISECLPVQIDEKDRLPKVICSHCAQQVEQIYEMRNISRNSQTILNNWLNHRTLQSEEKVFIKDAINDSGKSLSVVGTTSSGGLVASNASQQPNDLLSSIMQAVGMQVQQQQQQPQQQQPQQQYTITVDSHVPAQPLQHSHSQNDVKSEKQNTLEEFIRLKPDIKITPLGKKDNVHSTQSSTTLSSIKQQHQQQQQQPQQQSVQLQTQTITAVPAPAAQLQLQPQQINDINVLLQQQALWQQIQQLQAQSQLANGGDDATESKKPKLNFVLSSPATAPQFTGSLPQFGNVGGTQPQIQLQLLPGGASSSNNSTANIATVQPAQQLNAAALLSLTGTQLVGGSGAANMLSPNKCFLPITIRDENSDQQIVAHIDTKNLVLPTTYQVQMKLQPQLATADGQPIMQLTPTSIPATLQLTPQTLGNATAFQAATTTHQNQFLVPQPQPQQQPQQQQLSQQQQQHSQQQQQSRQQQQQLAPATAKVTSQQIIRSPHGNGNSSQVVIRNVSAEQNSGESSVTFKMPSPRQLQQPIQQQQIKYKATPSSASLVAAPSTVTSSNTPQTEFKRVPQIKQPPSQTGQTNVAALQRLSSNTTITKLPKQQHPVASHKLPLINKQNITISRISTQAAPKPEAKSAATAQAQAQAQVQVQAQAQVQAQPQAQLQLPKTEPAPPPPALAVQQLPTPPVTHILNQRKINRKPPEQNQKTKAARPQQQILPVPTAPQPQAQPQQQQQQLANSSITEPPTATPVNALTCPNCRREFKKKEHLTQHVKLHEGLRPFKCTEEGCDKAFSRKEHLSRHLVSHSGQKMFTCEECKKPFSRKDNLNKHKRTHNIQPGETRLHTCDICNKNFASKQQYEKHREMHKKSRAGNAASATQAHTGGTKNQYEVKQESSGGAPAQQPQSQMQIQQQPQQQQQQPPQQQQQQQPQQQHPQIMHVDLDGNTITITQAADSSMPSLANFVQLGLSQFHNGSGSSNQIVCKLEK